MKELFVSIILLFAVTAVFAQEKDELTGRQAPEFKLENVDGDYVALKDELGDGPVLLSFWATLV